MADSAAGKKKEGIWETVKTIFWALLIAGIFRTLFFQPFWIPSGSMKDTLLIGDFLFVNKMAYGYSRYSCPFSLCPINGRIMGSEPERGDVVVFRHPTRGVDFIKRVIGLPGDTVQVRGGRLWLNGIHLAEGGTQLRLQGRSQNQELLPQYLEALGRSPVFKGREFARLDVQRGADRLLDFDLSSRPAAQEKADE
jgi:signal peptidase I